jgi:hypothetical protein
VFFVPQKITVGISSFKKKNIIAKKNKNKKVF